MTDDEARRFNHEKEQVDQVNHELRRLQIKREGEESNLKHNREREDEATLGSRRVQQPSVNRNDSAQRLGNIQHTDYARLEQSIQSLVEQLKNGEPLSEIQSESIRNVRATLEERIKCPVRAERRAMLEFALELSSGVSGATKTLESIQYKANTQTALRVDLEQLTKERRFSELLYYTQKENARMRRFQDERSSYESGD